MIDVGKVVCHNEDTSILYHHGASRISKKAFQQAKMIITDNHESKMGRCHSNMEECIKEIVEQLIPSIKEYSRKQIDIVLSLVLYEQSLRDNEFSDLFCRFVEVLEDNGGVY